MARWDDGYVSDTIYTSGFYREVTPSWLSFAALLMGQRPPDLARPFRWAEFGCGNGFTACMLAALYPHAEFWGFDFNPAHIENARLTAAAVGAPNVTFEEAAFADLAAAPPSQYPQFDFIVAHGVISWISGPNRAALVAAIGRLLALGGLAYLSYNVLTGWASMLPVQHLMRLWTARAAGAHDVPGLLGFLDRLQGAGAGLFAANPAIAVRLGGVREQDARYFIHEFLNADWTPLMFDTVATEMDGAKCRFIGSATLPDNIDVVSVPGGMLPLLQEAREPRLREVLRDIGSAQGFRRDLYRRGVNTMSTAEQLGRLETLTLLGFGRRVEGEVKFAVSIGEVTGKPEIYQPLLALLAQGPVSLPQALGSGIFAEGNPSEVMQAFAMLVAGGYAHPMLQGGASEAARRATAVANLGLVGSPAFGTGLSTLGAASIGSAISADAIEILATADQLDGGSRPIADLADHIVALLVANGGGVKKDGELVTDRGEAGAVVAATLRDFEAGRAAAFRRLGILPAEAAG